MTDNIKTAEQAMGFEPDAVINLLAVAKTPNAHGREYQRHVAIEWEGGVLWLNFFDFVNTGDDKEGKHFCIDIRQINSGGKVKGQGVFTMAKQIERGAIAYDGEAQQLRNAMAAALERCQVADDRSGAADEAAHILEKHVKLDGTPATKQEEMPQGHGWNGGYLVSILTDPDGQESHTDDERSNQ